MGQASEMLDFLDGSLRELADAEVILLTAADEPIDGRSLRIGTHSVVNFGSCSYLGLEVDPRLKQAAIDAVERYGTQFSSSRTYLSAPAYEELEALLDQVFGGHTIVTPNTTLGHLSAIPVLVSEDDAAIFDHRVHQTVQLTIPGLRSQGSHVEFVRHNRIDLLEERIAQLSKTHRKVWYFADGIYSMHGDFAPTKALGWLLARHESLNLYLDDAHGVSWTGTHGRGFVLERIPSQERVVVAVSLNKSFAAGGGALVLPSEELRMRVRLCGGPMIFTGPVQPPMLGAAIASAKIHLSDEIVDLQQQLRDRIRFANQGALERGLPLVNPTVVPIRFVGLGPQAAVKDMTRHLIERGFYTNVAAFPAVAAQRCGIRFTLSLHHTSADIDALLDTMAERMEESLRIGGVTREEMLRSFGLADRIEEASDRPLQIESSRIQAGNPAAPAASWEKRSLAPPRATALLCEHETSIGDIDREEWDSLMEGISWVTSDVLALLEEAFNADEKPENRWRFHYYIIRERDGRPVLATVFSEALWKDDLLAAADVSREVEAHRERDPYFLTSPSLAMGTLITEGDHLFLDRSADWKGAMSLLLARVERDRDDCEASTLVVRDLPTQDTALRGFLRDQGFVDVSLPNAMLIDVDWSTREEYMSRLSKRARRFQREWVEPFDDAYEVGVIQAGGPEPDAALWAHLHALYSNVKNRNLTLNTFALPEGFFRAITSHPGWEILTLRLRGSHGGDDSAYPQGFAAGFASHDRYVPLVAGLDYEYVRSHSLYHQLLAQIIRRAESLGSKRIHLGMGAETAKARFGARAEERLVCVQSHDAYNHDVLALIAGDTHLAGPR